MLINFPLLRAALMLVTLITIPAHAAPLGDTTIINLSVDANRSAANDLVRAIVSAEASRATVGELSKHVNGLITDALKISKSYPSVKTQSSGTNTYPTYSKNGKIESWRMHSELSMESSDITALSELLGKLQVSLSILDLTIQPAPETRKKAENEAILDAIAAFKARAKVIADALGKSYRIKQFSVNANGRFAPPLFRTTAKSMVSDAVPIPVEVGESLVSATVSGQIELE